MDLHARQHLFNTEKRVLLLVLRIVATICLAHSFHETVLPNAWKMFKCLKLFTMILFDRCSESGEFYFFVEKIVH